MNDNEHHENLVSGLYGQLRNIFDSSKQGVYLYLDDTHKICNKNFADLLGYKSAKEWADTDAPLADIIEKDQSKVVKAYENAMKKMIASDMEAGVRNVKTGKLTKVKIILVPITYKGHLFALYFVSS